MSHKALFSRQAGKSVPDAAKEALVSRLVKGLWAAEMLTAQSSDANWT